LSVADLKLELGGAHSVNKADNSSQILVTGHVLVVQCAGTGHQNFAMAHEVFDCVRHGRAVGVPLQRKLISFRVQRRNIIQEELFAKGRNS
jgi:hypothetical protein